MYYVVYILAAFGVIFILIVLIWLVLWCFRCNINTQFVPVSGSDFVSVSVRNNSLSIDAEDDTIDAMEKMLEQYTKPKTIVSRQCICPFCTKEIDKLLVSVKTIPIVDDVITYPSSDNISQKTFIEIEESNAHNNDETAAKHTEDSDNKREVISNGGSNGPEVIEIVCDGEDTRIQIITNDNEPEQQCKLYNNVVSELKLKFESHP